MIKQYGNDCAFHIWLILHVHLESFVCCKIKHLAGQNLEDS